VVKRLCWIQVIAAFIAAALVGVEEETFLVTGPILTFLGFLIAWASLRQTSPVLLGFGLFSPLFTSLIAAMIAAFSMGPGQAKYYLWCLLPINAFAVLALIFKLEDSQPTETAAKQSLRFSLMHLLGLTTVVCLLLSVFRGLATSGENAMFAGYSLAVLAVSFAFVFLFVHKTKVSTLT